VVLLLREGRKGGKEDRGRKGESKRGREKGVEEQI